MPPPANEDAVEEANRTFATVTENLQQPKKYDDIIVKITLNDGFPVKIEKTFCEHITRRTTTKLVVQK